MRAEGAADFACETGGLLYCENLLARLFVTPEQVQTFREPISDFLKEGFIFCGETGKVVLDSYTDDAEDAISSDQWGSQVGLGTSSFRRVLNLFLPLLHPNNRFGYLTEGGSFRELVRVLSIPNAHALPVLGDPAGD